MQVGDIHVQNKGAEPSQAFFQPQGSVGLTLSLWGLSATPHPEEFISPAPSLPPRKTDSQEFLASF